MEDETRFEIFELPGDLELPEGVSPFLIETSKSTLTLHVQNVDGTCSCRETELWTPTQRKLTSEEQKEILMSGNYYSPSSP